jgi:uncharacterized protein YcfJ
MASPRTTIDLPQYDDESAKAYRARVEYVTMGEGRSLEKLADRAQSAPKARLSQRLATLKEWSARYGWVESARQYDQSLAYITVQEAQARYREDIAEYRQRYQQTGKDLHKVATALLGQMAQYMRGKTIEGKDGKTYTVPAFEMNGGTLGQIKSAFQAAADLEALALRIEPLLGTLDNAEPRNE